MEKASCYVKRCGKFVNLSKGDWEKPSFVKRVLGVWLTILDLVIFIHFGWAIFSLASWGFATFNLASNTNWNTVIPSPQTLLKSAAESIVEFLLMYFYTFNLLALLIILLTRMLTWTMVIIPMKNAREGGNNAHTMDDVKRASYVIVAMDCTMA